MPISDTLKALFNMMAAPVSVFDIRGEEIDLCHLNPASEIYFGISSLELSDRIIGARKQTYSSVQHKQIELLRNSIHICIANKHQYQKESKHVRHDGKHVWARHSFVPLSNQAGDIIQVMVTSIEVTELVEAKLKLAETMTKVLSGFVTICSGCKKIRHEQEWMAIDNYAEKHMDYHDFNKAVCDNCKKSK